MLSAMKCDEKGITFASIHDSFWTHACDRDELSGLLRDAFVHMHREDIIGRLKEEFDARYKGCMWYMGIKCKKSLATRLNSVRSSKPFQELCKQIAPGAAPTDAEILVETERCRLLSSPEEADQEKGRGMITPASVYAAEPHEAIIDVEEDVQEDVDEDAGPLAEEEHVEDLAAARKDLHILDVLLGKHAPTKSSTSASPWTMKAFVWQPLTFPHTPEKGTFDVRRLKQSKYFFH